MFKDSRNKGFTLVEVVIYLAVISVISVSIIGMALQVVRIRASTNSYALISSESSKVLEEILLSVRNCDSFIVEDEQTLEVTDNALVTSYYLESGRILQEQSSTVTPITTDQIQVTNISFVDWTSVNSSEVLHVSITFEHDEFNETYQTTIARR